MARTVKLSTGEEVTLKEHFTHRADKAYAAARDKGAVEKEYLEDGKTVIERPLANSSEAIDAALLVMIESVKRGETNTEPAPDWLDSLPETDHAALAAEMVTIRREGLERGKKSRG